MSGMQLNTDFSQIEPNRPGGTMFPVTTDKLGWLVHIIDSGPRETKKKDGMMCALKLEGLDGPVKGMQAEHLINVANPNPQAVEIGYKELSAIAHVVGVLRVGNSVELHRKPFRVLVRQQKDNPQYNEIYGYLDVNGNEPGKAGQGPVAAAPSGFQPGSQGQGGGFTPQGQGGQGQAPGWAPQGAQSGQGGFQGQGQGHGQGGQAPGWAPQGQGQGGSPGWAPQGQSGGAPGWSGGGNAQGGAPGWAGNQGNG